MGFPQRAVGRNSRSKLVATAVIDLGALVENLENRIGLTINSFCRAGSRHDLSHQLVFSRTSS